MNTDRLTSIWCGRLYDLNIFYQPMMTKIIVNRGICLDGAEVLPIPFAKTSFFDQLSLGGAE